MHPKEAYHMKTGTGRLSHLFLEESEIIIGTDFTENKRLNELLNDNHYYPVLLYPDKNAWTTQNNEFKNTIAEKTLLVIILDATWFFAKKMLRLSLNLHNLPKLSFYTEYTSQFIFKKQPAKECLSTIESCYYLIKELQDVYIVKKDINPEPLMELFKKMITYQLDAEKKRLDSGEPSRYSRKIKP